MALPFDAETGRLGYEEVVARQSMGLLILSVVVRVIIAAQGQTSILASTLVNDFALAPSTRIWEAVPTRSCQSYIRVAA